MLVARVVFRCEWRLGLMSEAQRQKISRRRRGPTTSEPRRWQSTPACVTFLERSRKHRRSSTCGIATCEIKPAESCWDLLPQEKGEHERANETRPTPDRTGGGESASGPEAGPRVRRGMGDDPDELRGEWREDVYRVGGEAIEAEEMMDCVGERPRFSRRPR